VEYEVERAVGRERRGHGQVRVPKQADGARAGHQRLDDVRLAKDVGVLVDGRAVTELRERIDRERARGQAAQVFPALLRQRIAGPVRRALSRGVETVGALQPRGNLVVVPANDRHGIECAHALDDAIGLRPVAHEVPEYRHAIVALGFGRRQHGFEGVYVRVDVAEDQIAHGISVPN
jgi:hypothetical protein